MYTDGQGAMKTAVGEAANTVAEDTRNRPPMFMDQDAETDGVQNESVERMVEENTRRGSDDDDDSDVATDNVGSPVMAMDPDPNEDTLIYTLSGADAGAFRVRDNGQIECGRDGVGLRDEEDHLHGHAHGRGLLRGQRHHHGDHHGHRHGRSAGLDRRSLYRIRGERHGGGGDYTAVDPEMTAIASWSLGGEDDADFTIEGGVLMFKESPDYEMAMDDGTNNMYMVTVQATDETNKVGMKR